MVFDEKNYRKEYYLKNKERLKIRMRERYAKKHPNSGKKIVQHHIKYKEIHGVDEIVLMEQGEHKRLHNRLRDEGKCIIPPKILHRIALAAHRRTPGYPIHRNTPTRMRYNREYNLKYKQSLVFLETMLPQVQFQERIDYNKKTGSICYSSRFKGNHDLKLHYIDEVTTVKIVESGVN